MGVGHTEYHLQGVKEREGNEDNNYKRSKVMKIELLGGLSRRLQSTTHHTSGTLQDIAAKLCMLTCLLP
jgi:hypothetical protein